MNTHNVKLIVGAVAALLLAGVAVALVFARLADLADQKGTRYKSQAALLAALPSAATAELSSRGLVLAGPLGCWTMPEATPHKLRVACSGQTARGRGVQILAASEQKFKKQFFTILVEGRPLVQNAPCLGSGCRAKRTA